MKQIVNLYGRCFKLFWICQLSPRLFKKDEGDLLHFVLSNIMERLGLPMWWGRRNHIKIADFVAVDFAESIFFPKMGTLYFLAVSH